MSPPSALVACQPRLPTLVARGHHRPTTLVACHHHPPFSWVAFVVCTRTLMPLPVAVVFGSLLLSLPALWRCCRRILPLSLQCCRQSSPSVESSELLMHNSRIGPVILRLLGQGQCAIAIVAAASVGTFIHMLLLLSSLLHRWSPSHCRSQGHWPPPLHNDCHPGGWRPWIGHRRQQHLSSSLCLAAILRSLAIGPVLCCCCTTICLWGRRRIGHRCRHCRHPNHHPPHPILGWLMYCHCCCLHLGLMSSLSLPPCPHKPTNQSSKERRQGRCLGANHVGIVAAPLPGVKEQAELGRRRMSSLSSLASLPTVCFRKQPEINQNWKSKIVLPCWKWFNVVWRSPNWEISKQIVGIAPGSLTGLAIVLTVMSKSWLLSVAPPSNFLQNSECKKSHSHQNKKLLVGANGQDPLEEGSEGQQRDDVFFTIVFD